MRYFNWALCLNVLHVELYCNDRCRDVADAAGEEGMEIVNPVIISAMINTGT